MSTSFIAGIQKFRNYTKMFPGIDEKVMYDLIEQNFTKKEIVEYLLPNTSTPESNTSTPETLVLLSQTICHRS